MEEGYRFRALVAAARFDEAAALAAWLPSDQVRDELLIMAFDTGSMAPYAFACAMVIRGSPAEWHQVAAELMTLPLCHLTDAYRVALFHARQATALAPDDILLKEFLLFFYTLPDQLISREEAEALATAILLENPESEAALAVLIGE